MAVRCGSVPHDLMATFRDRAVASRSCSSGNVPRGSTAGGLRRLRTAFAAIKRDLLRFLIERARRGMYRRRLRGAR